FGEYLANTERGPMRIYKYRAGSHRLEVAYTFPAGSITHIHGLYADPLSDDIYCLTGDAPSECRLLKSANGFETFDTGGEGDESWRAVSLLFAETALYYGTDAEFHDNHIVRLSRGSLQREMLGEVNG